MNPVKRLPVVGSLFFIAMFRDKVRNSFNSIQAENHSNIYVFAQIPPGMIRINDLITTELQLLL
ncbi:hypothetical protein DMZ48_15585 [Robertkochia solimangrovi]|nr:hypothetical protein DMZ48_15585 [Robertkochia solimangrovi]